MWFIVIMVTQLKVYTSSDNQPSKEQSVKLVSENLKESHSQPNSVRFSLFQRPITQDPSSYCTNV